MITTIYVLTHSSNVEEVKKLIPNIIVLPEAGLGPYDEEAYLCDGWPFGYFDPGIKQ